ncbi:unnamed protein product [Eruca vesicaria subsp. sativa]|uniref:Uncharacterized protein n=1 Tax=Eruca vesicaria subsp. sativa TaxID=29727 RepID=A0ABC8JS56_ERUVS|nr:unnamed protein product [Eruca vesicaria subsp. sativa]
MSSDDSELYLEEEEEEEDGDYELFEEKTSYTSSTMPQSCCSRGISTETIVFTRKKLTWIRRNKAFWSCLTRPS